MTSDRSAYLSARGQSDIQRATASSRPDGPFRRECVGLELEIHAIDPDIALIVLAGIADEFTGMRLRRELLGAIVGGRVHLVLEMRALMDLDSTGLGAMVSALKAARRRNGSVQLVGSTPRVRKVLRITGLTFVIPTASSVRVAVQAVHLRTGGRGGGVRPAAATRVRRRAALRSHGRRARCGTGATIAARVCAVVDTVCQQPATSLGLPAPIEAISR